MQVSYMSQRSTEARRGIVLLAMMVSLHGKKQSSFGDTVLEVLSVASTLWPILFAAVLGPLLKSIALFRAERGISIRLHGVPADQPDHGLCPEKHSHDGVDW